MQPCKKLKTEPALNSDPFDDEEDWGDDDILQLVADEVPTYSQMSQAIKAPPLNAVGPRRTPDGRPRSFVFKRPSSSTSSLLSTKPTSYTTAPANDIIDVEPVNSSQVCEKSLNNGASHGSQLKMDSSLDVMTVQKQMADLIRKQHANEGEIKWLRSTLKDKDNQINVVRTTLNADKAKQKLQNSEKERGYIKDIEALRSELQFKESEMIGVVQTLDKLKREKAKPVQPVMKLGADGFPVATAGFNTSSSPPMSVSTIKSKRLKMEPVEPQTVTPTAQSSGAELKCDLKPFASNRLVSRKLSTGEFKRKMLVSGMLKSNMESIQNKLKSCGLDNGHNATNSEQQHCLQLISESIVCAKDLCYL